jgi:hypothetical protein
MSMTEAERDEAFKGLSKLTEELVCAVKKMAGDANLPMGGVPSSIFNAYQDIVVEQIEICANSNGGDTALSYIGVQMHSVKNFVEIMRNIELQIKIQKKSFESGESS